MLTASNYLLKYINIRLLLYSSKVTINKICRGINIYNKRIYLLLGIPLVSVTFIAFYLGGPVAGVLTAVAGLIVAMSVYRMSPKILLKWYGARRVSHEKHSFVYSQLEELSSRSDVALPHPYVFDSVAPITFTVGNNKEYYLLVSTSSLDMLDEDELKSILALEVAKISKGAVALNTLVALLAGSIAAFSTVALWMAMLTGFGQEDDPAPRFISFLVMGIVALPSALLVHLFAIDSTVEADRMAAGMTAEPYLLAQALERTGTHINLYITGGFNPGHAHLFSVNPLKANTIFDVYSSMFLTKPDVDQRVMYLENIKYTGQ